MVWYWAQIGVTEIDGVHLDWWHLSLRLLVTCRFAWVTKQFGRERLHEADHETDDDDIGYDVVGLVEEDEIHNWAKHRTKDETDDEAAAARHRGKTELGRFMPLLNKLRRGVDACHIDRSRSVMNPTVQ